MKNLLAVMVTATGLMLSQNAEAGGIKISFNDYPSYKYKHSHQYHKGYRSCDYYHYPSYRYHGYGKHRVSYYDYYPVYKKKKYYKKKHKKPYYSYYEKKPRYRFYGHY